jgi:hypothetical protein
MSGLAWMLRRLADGSWQSPAVGNGRPGHGQRSRRPLAAAAHKGGTGGGKSRLAARDGRYCREMMSP